MADELIERDKERIKRKAGDGDVIIRVIFEGARKPDGDHDDTIIEQEIKKGNPNKPKEIYQIYVKGLTENGGLTAAGSIIRRWINEPPQSIDLVELIPTKPIPTKVNPWEPLKVTNLPPIPKEPNTPHFKPIPPTIHIPPRPFSPPPKPIFIPPTYNVPKTDKSKEIADIIVHWLKDNPMYKITITQDGYGIEKDKWDDKSGGKTLSQIAIDWYIRIKEQILVKYGNSFADRVNFRLGFANGRTTTYSQLAR